MIHTMDISCSLQQYQFAAILNEHNESKSLVTSEFSRQGITELAVFEYNNSKTNHHGYYLQIIMNPSGVMAGRPDPMALFDETDFAELIPAFDSCMQQITRVSLKSLPEWKARRIDYAQDAETGNSPIRPASQCYVDLARLGALPYKSKANAGNPEWESYLEGNDSCKVRIYARGPALRTRFLGLAESVYTDADKLLRLEVECGKGRLTTLAKKYDHNDRAVKNFLTHPEIGPAELARQAACVFGYGNYLSFNKAAARIKASRLQKRSKEDLRGFLKSVTAAGGFMNAQSRWNKGKPVKFRFNNKNGNACFSASQIKRIKRDLRELQINTVPVPPSWHRGEIEHPFPELVGGSNAGNCTTEAQHEE